MDQKTKERRILDSINEACYELDTSGTIVFLNKKARLIFDAQKGPMLNRNIWDVFPEYRNTLYFDAVQVNALQNKRAAKFEYQSPVTHTWISMEAIPTDEGCIVLFHEIEELKQAQKKYHGLIDNLPDMITRWNKDLKLIFANKALEEKLGVPNEKLYGKTKSEMGLPDAVALPWMESFRKAFANGKKVTHFSAVPLPSGTIHFHSHIIPEKNKLGEVETIMCIARDISDLKEAEQELKELNTQLELKNKVHAYAEEIACMGSWTWNSATNESLYSDNMFRLFGLQPGEVEPNLETIPPFLHPEDRKKVLGITNHQDENGDPVSVEYRVIRKDGELRTFRNRLKTINSPDRKAVFVGITEDITEHKKNRDELLRQTELLKENKEFIEQITSHMTELISVLEVSTLTPTYFNRQPLSMTGYTTEEITQMTPQERQEILVHPNDRAAVQEYYDKLETLADDSIVEVKYRFRKKGGDLFWFHVRGKVFKRDKNGLPTHTLHIGNDITEQKKAEEQVKEQFHFINKVAATMPDMLSVMRLSDLAVTYANKEPFRLNTFDLDNIKGRSRESRKKMIHPDDLPAMSLYFAGFQDCGEKDTQQLEYRAQTDKGDWEWFRVRGKVFKRNAEGQPTHCVNIVQNIDRWKKAEQQVMELKLQKQKEILDAILFAQEQERERIGEALHNGVAQLLYAIHTRLQLIEINDAGQLKALMSIVHEAISETKRISFELTPVVLKDHGLDTAIRSLIQRLAMRSPLIEFNMPRLKRRLPEKLEYAVYRIAQELLNNCIKHSKATRVTINIRQVDEILHLEVSDNGIGFDFKKLKPMDKGIGLQSVKNRVRLLEGTQEIQSSAEGTTIRIYIPITPSP